MREVSHAERRYVVAARRRGSAWPSNGNGIEACISAAKLLVRAIRHDGRWEVLVWDFTAAPLSNPALCAYTVASRAEAQALVDKVAAAVEQEGRSALDPAG